MTDKHLEEIHKHIANKINIPKGYKWKGFMYTSNSIGIYMINEKENDRWIVQLTYYNTHITVVNSFRTGGHIYPSQYYADPNFFNKAAEIIQEAISKQERIDRIYTNPACKLEIIKTF